MAVPLHRVPRRAQALGHRSGFGGGGSLCVCVRVCVCVCARARGSPCYRGRPCRGLRAACLERGGVACIRATRSDAQCKRRHSPLKSALAWARAALWLEVMKLPYLRGRAAPPGVRGRVCACGWGAAEAIGCGCGRGCPKGVTWTTRNARTPAAPSTRTAEVEIRRGRGQPKRKPQRSDRRKSLGIGNHRTSAAAAPAPVPVPVPVPLARGGLTGQRIRFGRSDTQRLGLTRNGAGAGAGARLGAGAVAATAGGTCGGAGTGTLTSTGTGTGTEEGAGTLRTGTCFGAGVVGTGAGPRAGAGNTAIAPSAVDAAQELVEGVAAGYLLPVVVQVPALVVLQKLPFVVGSRGVPVGAVDMDHPQAAPALVLPAKLRRQTQGLCWRRGGREAQGLRWGGTGTAFWGGARPFAATAHRPPGVICSLGPKSAFFCPKPP